MRAKAPFAGILVLSAFVLTPLPGQEVNIPDANLDAALHQALNKPTGAITDTDLASLTSLAVESRGITDLTGLEYAINLTMLDLAASLQPYES